MALASVPVPGLGLALGLTTDQQGVAFIAYAVSPKTRALARLTTDTQRGEFVLEDVVEGTYVLRLAEASGIVAHGGSLYVTDNGYLWGFDARTGAITHEVQVNATADSFGLAIHPLSGTIIIANAR